jgi:hypothetical protein
MPAITTGLAAPREAIRICRIGDSETLRVLPPLQLWGCVMRIAVLLALFFIPAAAYAQDAAAPATQPSRIGGKPLALVKPSAPVGCKFVGTVRSTKLWAGDCTAADHPATVTGEETSPVPLADQAARAIPKGPQ